MATTASVLNHNFRDPVQVDLVFLDPKYNSLSVEEILAEDSIKLTLVEGHDRVLGVCATLFKKDPNNPPGNIDVVRNAAGKVVDWLVPATIARSENRAKAVAYSVDHNLTTASVLGDDTAMALFDTNLLLDQMSELACEGEAIYGFSEDMAEIAARLMDEPVGEEGEEAPAGEGEGDGTGGSEDDELPEEAPSIVKEGEVWQLGRHRLFCGNSCDEQAVLTFLAGVTPTFVWADPPYGVEIVKGGSVGGSKPFGSVGGDNIIAAGVYAPVIGDDTIETAVTAFNLCQQFSDATQIWWGANYYASALPNSQCWFVWDKNNTGNFADCELAWVNLDRAARLFKHTWNGMIKESEHGQKRVHPTQKPIALIVKALEIFGSPNCDDIILDPFSGSGIGILGAEQTGATCYAMELSPAYCDVCILRWERLTGLTAIKISG